MFSLASTLGDEAFYTVALPLCAWILDLGLSRRLAFFWASTYYVGQATKVCVWFTPVMMSSVQHVKKIYVRELVVLSSDRRAGVGYILRATSQHLLTVRSIHVARHACTCTWLVNGMFDHQHIG